MAAFTPIFTKMGEAWGKVSEDVKAKTMAGSKLGKGLAQ